MKLILLGLCLLLVKESSSQNKPPVLIPLGQDTLVGISQRQFDVILFSFSYIKELEKLDTIALSELNNLDGQIYQRDSVIALERLKMAQMDSINMNLQKVIGDYKKERRKQKLKSTFTYIGLSLVAGVEAGVITYLLIK